MCRCIGSPLCVHFDGHRGIEQQATCGVNGCMTASVTVCRCTCKRLVFMCSLAFRRNSNFDGRQCAPAETRACALCMHHAKIGSARAGQRLMHVGQLKLRT